MITERLNVYDEVTPKPILIALRICPDLKFSSLGNYQNLDTKIFVDNKLSITPEMMQGLTIDNYPEWIRWSIKILGRFGMKDPVLEYYKDLRDDIDGVIQIPWFMSFKEKGFDVSGQMSTNKIHLMSFKDKGLLHEREYFPVGRRRIAMERIYDENGNLDSIVSLYKDSRRRTTLLRIDYVDMWSYQYLQGLDVFDVGSKNIHLLARDPRPLAKAALNGGFAYSIYTGDIVKGL
jgi:hypothetical protein